GVRLPFVVQGHLVEGVRGHHGGAAGADGDAVGDALAGRSACVGRQVQDTPRALVAGAHGADLRVDGDEPDASVRTRCEPGDVVVRADEPGQVREHPVGQAPGSGRVTDVPHRVEDVVTVGDDDTVLVIEVPYTPPSSAPFGNCFRARGCAVTGSSSTTVGGVNSSGSVPAYAVHNATGIPSPPTNTDEHVPPGIEARTSVPAPGPLPGMVSVE